MNTYQETLGYDQINYEQDIYYINSIKAKKKKNNTCSQFCLIFGLIFIVIQIGLNLLIIMGKGLSLSFADCEREDKKCKEQYEKESKNYHKACDFTLPYFIITCIIIGLSIYRRKKIILISINFILIIFKITIFFYYIKYLIISMEYDDSKNTYKGFIIGLEIGGNLLVIISEIFK